MTTQTAINAPIGKVAYPTAFASVVTIGVFVAKSRGIYVPPDIAVAITTVGTFLLGYLTPLKSYEVKP